MVKLSLDLSQCNSFYKNSISNLVKPTVNLEFHYAHLLTSFSFNLQLSNNNKKLPKSLLLTFSSTFIYFFSSYASLKWSSIYISRVKCLVKSKWYGSMTMQRCALFVDLINVTWYIICITIIYFEPCKYC